MAKSSPYAYIIRAKKSVFRDFYIPWDVEIERRLEREMCAKPDADPECVLDRICRPYISRKLEWTEADTLKTHKGI